jgi:RNA polymerase sigma-70 factor (ECF subfamily)
MAAESDRLSSGREADAWRQRLAAGHPEREAALAELHRLLLAGARTEANRRSGSLPDTVRAEADDLCQQAADDALAAVVAKIDTFRGDSRFTTWAYKFAIFEISTRLRRHAWRGRRVELEDEAWNQLEAPDDSAPEKRQVLRLVREGMDTALSERQRLVFNAVVLQEIPIDVLAERLDTTRGAIYKQLHDARRKLRRHVEAGGYAEHLP